MQVDRQQAPNRCSTGAALRQPRKPAVRAVAVAVAALVMGSCGGGGGGDSKVEPPATIQETVALSPEVLALPSSASITTIQSPIDEVAVGQKIDVFDLPASGRTLLFATTAAGEPLLMGFGSGETILGIESTAAALVELAVTMLESDAVAMRRQVISTALGLPEYDALVQAVRKAVTAGAFPGGDPEVLSALQSVVMSAASSVSGLAGASVASKVSAPAFPYCVLDKTLERFCFTEGLQGQDVTARNATLLTWHVVSTNRAGIQIDEEYMDPAILAAAGALVGRTEQIGGSSNQFKLRLEQDANTKLSNATRLVKQGVGVFFSAVELISPVPLDFSCANKVTANLVATKTSVVINAVQDPTALFSIVEDLKDAAIEAVIEECVIDGITDTLKDIKGVAWAASLGKWIGALQTANDSVALFSGIRQTSTYANRAFEFDVCRYQGRVAPCTRRLSAPPAPITVAVGESTTVQISAFGDANMPIAMAPPLDLQSTSPSVATVDPTISDGMVTIQGVNVGTTTILVTDPVTGVALPQPISVTVTASSFWEGSFEYTDCFAPGYAGSGDPCAFVTASLKGGGQFSGAGALLARLDNPEENNVRLEHRLATLDACASASNVDFVEGNQWSVTYNIRCLFSCDWNDQVTLKFLVTSRTPQEVLGTFTGDFVYPIDGPNFEQVRQTGRVDGIWSLRPRNQFATPTGPAFPKCSTKGYSFCTAFGAFSWDRHFGDFDANNGGDCDYRDGLSSPAREGEWRGLP